MAFQLLPLLLSAAGTAISTANNNSVLHDKDRENARRMLAQAELNRKAGDRVQQNVKQLQQSNPDAERMAAQEQFIQALHAAKLTGGRNNSFDESPGGSTRFAEDVGAARAASGTEGTQMASRLARIDAPLRQRVREGQGQAAAASDLSLLEQQAANEDFLSQLRTSMIRPNPWAQAGGDVLGGLGSTLATRPPGVKKPPKPTLTDPSRMPGPYDPRNA